MSKNNLESVSDLLSYHYTPDEVVASRTMYLGIIAGAGAGAFIGGSAAFLATYNLRYYPKYSKLRILAILGGTAAFAGAGYCAGFVYGLNQVAKCDTQLGAKARLLQNSVTAYVHAKYDTILGNPNPFEKKNEHH